MNLRLFKTMIAATMLIVSVVLTGCGGTAVKDDTSEEGNKNSDTVVVTDAKGQVEIPANPKRIVDISGNSDILSILGYSVIGTANSDAYDYTKFPSYLEKALEGAEILGYSMQDTMDVEAILALEPDLIIISSVQETMYKQLQEVAPTVMIELAQIDWTEDIKKVASIFNKTEEADQWLDQYKTKAEQMGEQLKETYGKDTSYLAFLASGGSIFVFDSAGVGSILYDDMGLKKPEGMPQQTDISLPVVTYEGLAAIDADYIFAIGTEDDLTALYKSSIWKGMRAVKDGKVIELPSSPYFNMGYSSIGRIEFINEVKSLLESVNE